MDDRASLCEKWIFVAAFELETGMQTAVKCFLIGASVSAAGGCATIPEIRQKPAETSFVAPVAIPAALACVVDGVQNARLFGVPFTVSVVPLGNGGQSVSLQGDARSFVDLSPVDGGTLIEHRRSGLLATEPFGAVVRQCRGSLVRPG